MYHGRGRTHRVIRGQSFLEGIWIFPVCPSEHTVNNFLTTGFGMRPETNPRGDLTFPIFFFRSEPTLSINCGPLDQGDAILSDSSRLLLPKRPELRREDPLPTMLDMCHFYS
ncbi:hypothetical protein ASPCADRAFT_204322 [Aspergillus carbonarius ITEM 5010]|uniref:Uncharacterized protein n=1 Tax=Aspergillus carbonarius (strain ITEM 5010) TaxID=602072 RepID=A0A1R3RVT5_ASPC5|nr:hypothetical protein ASPCADRAFT_204322 [Aspergillus carbonarius ITEM 5010]